MREKGTSLVKFIDNYCVIDIETTGLDPEFDEIIEVSAIKYVDGIKSSFFSELIHPVNDIDEYIAELTGITNDIVSDCRIIEEVLPEFIEFLGNDVLVGHNVNFDINFIYDNLFNLNGCHFKNDYVDTMRLSRRLLPVLQSQKLSSVSSHLGIVSGPAHRALSDCETTAQCYCLLKQKAIDKYGSLDDFYKSLIKSHKGASAKDILTSKAIFDISHPFYQKVCCFTGVLSIPRKEAMQKVVDLGGLCSDSFNKKTNYLIMGNTDYCAGVTGGKTAKMKKAEQAKLAGQDIDIISENVFFDMLNQ